MTSNQAGMLVYIGTYTRSGKSKGIYVYRFNPSNGKLTYVDATSGISNPSFVALHPNGRYLYSVSEIADHEGRRTGSVYAYSIDRSTGKLTPLNVQPSQGTGPCHVNVEATGKYVLVANYQSGSVAMFPVQSDGSLGEASDAVQHQGSSVDKDRQVGPHAHCIFPDPTNKFAIVNDLGTDKVMVYRLDLAAGKLPPNNPPSASVQAGLGPRHLDFHPNGRFVFVIHELGNMITSFAYDSTHGSLTEIQTAPSLPEGWSGTSHTADIHVAPSGKFLYGSNRGHDSLVIYAIDPATGKLTYVGHESTRGKTPRNFAIDPSGTFLFAENQNSDTIHTFRIDQKTGKLTATGDVTEVPSPVCLKFLP
jgi:6-phosphogluconolactonase